MLSRQSLWAVAAAYSFPVSRYYRVLLHRKYLWSRYSDSDPEVCYANWTLYHGSTNDFEHACWYGLKQVFKDMGDGWLLNYMVSGRVSNRARLKLLSCRALHYCDWVCLWFLCTSSYQSDYRLLPSREIDHCNGYFCNCRANRGCISFTRDCICLKNWLAINLLSEWRSFCWMQSTSAVPDQRAKKAAVHLHPQWWEPERSGTVSGL